MPSSEVPRHRTLHQFCEAHNLKPRAAVPAILLTYVGQWLPVTDRRHIATVEKWLQPPPVGLRAATRRVGSVVEARYEAVDTTPRKPRPSSAPLEEWELDPSTLMRHQEKGNTYDR